MPTKVLVGTEDIVSQYLSNIYNNSKNKQKYPISLKVADVTPIHKAKENFFSKNYRPPSLIPIVSKLFERNMFDQISYIKLSITISFWLQKRSQHRAVFGNNDLSLEKSS